MQISYVVSLGTGMIPVTELKEIDVFRPDSLFDAAKLAYGISAIGEYLFIQYERKKKQFSAYDIDVRIV